MKKYTIQSIALILFLTSPYAFSQQQANEHKIGKLAIVEESNQITILDAKRNATSARILPGGRYWPNIYLWNDEIVTIGERTFSISTGKEINQTKYWNANTGILPSNNIHISSQKNNLLITKKESTGYTKTCIAHVPLTATDIKLIKTPLLQQLNITVSNKKIGTLLKHVNKEGKIDSYEVDMYDQVSCRLLSRTHLSNPDLLIELGWSKKGGWWLVGSIEQTLLQSDDGRHWRLISLPTGVHSLVSAYIVSNKETWIAAGMAGDTNDSPMVARTLDGGTSWKPLETRDPSLVDMPSAWLEGLLRSR